MKTYIQETVEACLADDETVSLADGFEQAFVGIARQFNKVMAVYDLTKCLAILMEQGMDLDSAKEYMEFNVTGAWVGENTPAFLTTAPDDWEQERCKMVVMLAKKAAFSDSLLRLLIPYVSPGLAKSDEERELCLEILHSARKLVEEVVE
jgi:hypothetical protein